MKINKLGVKLIQEFEGCKLVNWLLYLFSNQFNALVSFTFTVDENAFADSTLLRLLNSGDYESASTQFFRWDKVDGQPSRRRKAKMELFLTEEV